MEYIQRIMVYNIGIFLLLISTAFSQNTETPDSLLIAKPVEPETLSIKEQEEYAATHALYIEKAQVATEAAKDAVQPGESKGLGWRTWTKITTFTLAVAFGEVAAYKHHESRRQYNNVNNLKKQSPSPERHDRESDYVKSWQKDYDTQADLLEKREFHRNIYGIAAGIMAAGGMATFFF